MNAECPKKIALMKNTILAWIALSCMTLAYAGSLGAADAEQGKEIHQLDAVVVSATRSEIPVFDAPQDVSVITAEEIMASPFQRVEDIVRSVPGVSNFRHYGLQTNGVVSPLIMRGAGKNRVLLLVDGVPQNDNFNNAIAWVAWGHIPKETIERIEIVRGPTSALYGSEGLGGVIHIITRNPTAKRQTSISGEAGTADTYAGSVFHSQKGDQLGMMLAGGYEDSDGFLMTDRVESYTLKRYREAGKVFGKATYDISPESEATFSALYYDHEMGKGREFFYDELQLDQYSATYSRQTGGLGLKGLLYLNHADKTAYQDTAKDNYTSLYRVESMPSTYTWGADLQGTLPVLAWADLTLGAAYKEASWKYDEDYPGLTRDAGAEGTQRFVSPFANLNLNLLDKSLLMSLGARYDWIETSDGANWDTKPDGGIKPYRNAYQTQDEGNFSPKLGIAFHPDAKTTLRTSGGKGFRAPSLFELYKVHVRGGGTYYRTANPDLQPEEIWSYDFGGERFLSDTVWAKATFYQSFASDYIGDRLTGSYVKSGKTYYEYELDNISKVDIYGLETELQWYPLENLTVFGNYSYTVSEIEKDEENKSLEGNHLPNDPKHSIHVGLNYNHPRFATITLLGNYYADIYYDNENTLKTEDYWTVDLGLSRRFMDQFTVFLNVENLFDKEYPIFLSASEGNTIAPGAIITGGFKFEF